MNVPLSEMTDEQIVDAVAREVMGWELIPAKPGTFGHAYFRESDDKYIRDDEFRPLHDANDALRVLEKFDVSSIYKCEGGTYLVALRNLGCKDFTHECEGFCRAICLAAIAVVRGNQNV